MEYTKGWTKHRFLADIATSFVTGSLISTFVLGRLINPRSELGQFVFWPQDFLSSLRFGSNSALAPRILFTAIIIAVSIFVWIALKVSGLTDREPVRRVAYGLLAIAAPFVGWLVAKGSHIAWAGGVLTAVYTLAAVLFSTGRWSLPISAWYVLLALRSAWWVFLFQKELDPIMLLIPLSSLCAALIGRMRDRKPCESRFSAPHSVTSFPARTVSG